MEFHGESWTCPSERLNAFLLFDASGTYLNATRAEDRNSVRVRTDGHGSNRVGAEDVPKEAKSTHK